MEWNNEENHDAKKSMSLSSKILIVMIVGVILIIALIIVLLINIPQGEEYTIYADEKATKVNKGNLLATIDEITYINIEEFAKIVGYEYHKGEYKSNTIDENKCHVEGANETASFYLNDNKIYKLPSNKLENEYEEYNLENTIQSYNNGTYASIDGISRAFNVVIDINDNYFKIYTLDYLVKSYDKKATEWGYTSISDLSFENKKAILYGFLIVKKEGGLYKIINLDNTREIVLERYTSIEFSENMEEFLVKDNSEKVGIINLDGTVKIEPTYEEMSVLDKKLELYLIKQSDKYGVINGSNNIVIFPEYDAIGLKDANNNSQFIILDTLIPVCKNEKWGAYNKEGKMILDIKYDGFGYNSTNIEIKGTKESVQPVLGIEKCKGVVVKKDDKYGLIDVKGKLLISISFDAIYAEKEIEDARDKYFMLYKGEKFNVIKQLIKKGLIKENEEEIDDSLTVEIQSNNTINNVTNN